MHMFIEFSVLLAIALGISIIMRLLRQPLIIGHIITGIIVGPLVFSLISSTEMLTLFSEIGIAILLFIVGLHLSPKTIKEFGKVSLITGVGQVVITSLAGFLICIALGMNVLTSVYVGIALAFSSTIIIMKLITDRGDTESLYAKISIGFLLVQDLVAVLLLFFIPLLASGDLTAWALVGMLAKSALMILGVYIVAHYIFPRIGNFLAKSQELLFIFTIAWGLGVSALFKYIGFSLESGALIAGVALSTLPARSEISSRLSPLRDFFIIIFFVLLGAQMELSNLLGLLPTAIGLSLLVLIGNPLILMSIMGLMGYRKKTSLQTGFTVAQISEFSLILIALGFKFGHVDQATVSLVTLVGLITIFGSTYLILYSDKIYKLLEKYLSIFERKHATEKVIEFKEYKAILFGSNRVGHSFLETLKKQDDAFLVVDHDPEIIEKLTQQGYDTLYGDAGDVAFLEELPLATANLIISTVPDLEVNSLLNRMVKAANPDAIFIAAASKVDDAFHHYDNEVDYVILPHFLGSKHAAEIVIKMKGDKKKYKNLKKKHIEDLKLRIAVGQEHPTV